MRPLLCIVLLAAAAVARAGDLEDADRLLAARAYDKALPLYQRLAEAGNPQAQMHLGEMLWFGDGTAPDLAKAKMWFERSAAAGNADAKADLAGLTRRETHGDEIVYWTSKYQGEDMVSGKFDCKRPELPAVSKTRADIKATSDRIVAWHTCYNGFVANLNDALPPGKRIPAETLDMMTPSEGAQAQRHLDGVYGGLIRKAQTDAAEFSTREAAWRKATEAYLASAAHDSESGKEDLLTYQRRMNEAISQQHVQYNQLLPAGRH